jgi:hypothetical protein
MPALHKSIEHVTLTLSSGTNPAQANLTKGQDPAACTPYYSIREAGAAVTWVNGNLLPEVWFDDNGGTARVNAQLLTGDDVQVEIFVVEWDLTKVNVQQGTFTIASGQVFGTAAISAVDQSKAFIVPSWRMATASGFWFDRACHRAKFTSDTEITFSRFTSSTLQTTTGRFYVVECIGTEFAVQFLELSNDASSQGATAYNQAISAVDMAKTFIVGGYTAGNNDDDPVDGAMWWALTSTTNVQFQRLGGGTPAGHFMNTSVFVVTCANDEWTVQRAQPTIGSGETADDTTITAIDQARSVINPGSNMSLTMGHTNTTTGAASFVLGFTFAADTTVRASRRITGSLASAYAFEVVQFAEPETPGVSIVVPLASTEAGALAPGIAAGAKTTIPLAGTTASALAPAVATGASTTVPLAATETSALAPAVVAGAAVAVPLAQTEASALAPAVAAGSAVDIAVPLAATETSALAPSIAAGTNVNMPLAATEADALAPVVVSGARIAVPLAETEASALAPAVAAGAVVTVPLAATQADALAPSIVAGSGIVLPLAATVAAAFAPAVAAGARVVAPLAETVAAAFAPTIEILAGANIAVPLAETETASIAPSVAAGSRIVIPLAETETIAFAPTLLAITMGTAVESGRLSAAAMTGTSSGAVAGGRKANASLGGRTTGATESGQLRGEAA